MPLGAITGPEPGAKAEAERRKVEIRTYTIIYELIKDIEAAVKGMLEPKFREEYLKVGGSPHNFIHRAMLSALRESFCVQGDDRTRFYIAFLDSDPRPDEAAVRAVNEGASALVFGEWSKSIVGGAEGGSGAPGRLAGCA